VDIILILALALAIDLAWGEPPGVIHPVVWMGKVASFLIAGGRGRPRWLQFVCGAGVTLLLIGLFAAASYFILFYLEGLSSIAYVVVGGMLLKSTFSLRELGRAALRVKELLLGEELDKARGELRSLAGRSTGGLDRPLLVSATVESVAENTSDSFVAPLFYFLLFGVPGAIGYRVVNTLDAIIGYHGEYEYLGKFASRLDDVVNFIPARLTALLLVLASFLLRKNARVSWRVAVREHARTESPNAGWPMAAVAGALGVELEKSGHYKLGRGGARLVPGTIDGSLKLMRVAALVWVAVCFIVGVTRFVVTA